MNEILTWNFELSTEAELMDFIVFGKILNSYLNRDWATKFKSEFDGYNWLKLS